MTLWAAYQHFEETTKGSIEVGKVADFAILSDNPLTIDPLKIADIEVVETIKNGKSIYRREPVRAGASFAALRRLAAVLRAIRGVPRALAADRRLRRAAPPALVSRAGRSPVPALVPRALPRARDTRPARAPEPTPP